MNLRRRLPRSALGTAWTTTGARTSRRRKYSQAGAQAAVLAAAGLPTGNTVARQNVIGARRMLQAQF
jgi:hypothetical protein